MNTATLKISLPCLLLFLFAAFVCGAAEETRPLIFGHRGALEYAPENTLAAFELCARTGVDIELDVWATRDGKLVVMHDSTLDRTSDGHGNIADKTLAEIKRLDAGAWFHSDFRGEPVPTLDEVFERVRATERHPIAIGLDMKAVNATIMREVVETVSRHNRFNRTFVFSISPEQARQFKALDPRMRCAATALKAEEITAALALDWIDLIVSGPQSKDVIEAVHRAGKNIYCTLVNDAALWRRLYDDGVAGIFTNFPMEMKQVLSPQPPERAWDHYLSPKTRTEYRFRAP